MKVEEVGTTMGGMSGKLLKSGFRFFPSNVRRSLCFWILMLFSCFLSLSQFPNHLTLPSTEMAFTGHICGLIKDQNIIFHNTMVRLSINIMTANTNLVYGIENKFFNHKNFVIFGISRFFITNHLKFSSKE